MGRIQLFPKLSDFVRITNFYVKECDTKNRIPLLGELALLCGVDTDTLGKYRQKPKYGGIIKRIDQMQENALLNKGLNENKPVFSIFLLKAKHGYIESQYQKVDLNVSGQLAVVQMPAKKTKIVSG